MLLGEFLVEELLVAVGNVLGLVLQAVVVLWAIKDVEDLILVFTLIGPFDIVLGRLLLASNDDSLARDPFIDV